MSRLAVVSGGGTGIGLAVAEALLRDGDEVLLVGRRAAVLDEAVTTLSPLGTVSSVVADASDPESVAAVRDAVAGRTVDVVVANAGAAAVKAGPDLGEIAAAWEGAFRANVLSAVLLVEALTPSLARPGGRIVLVGSAAALRGNSTASYAAMKASLHGWVKVLADKLGPDGITANVVAPGWTEGTEITSGRIPPERRVSLLAFIAAGRSAVAAEIAHVVRAVAAPEASYLNGQVVVVDGGFKTT